MNSDRNMASGFQSARREIEVVGEIEVQPLVERNEYVRLVEGATVVLNFPGMEGIETTSRENGAVSVSLDRLMTRPLASAPRFVEGVATFRGAATPVSVRAESC